MSDFLNGSRFFLCKHQVDLSNKYKRHPHSLNFNTHTFTRTNLNSSLISINLIIKDY